MAIGVFVAVYLVLLVLGAAPLVYAIAAAVFTIPLFFSQTANFGLAEISAAFVNASAANNTGLTVILFHSCGRCDGKRRYYRKDF